MSDGSIPEHAPTEPGPAGGLHAPPRGGLLGGVFSAARPLANRGRMRLALQGLGFLVGLGLLVWALSLALSEKNRRSLEMIAQAELSTVAWLLLVSAASVLLNGLMFWVVLRPLRKLNPLDVMLANAIAAFLSILPFKINLLTRLLIHHRRDGVSVKDILSWLAAMSVLALSVLFPVGLAGWWRGRIDGVWWVLSIGGTVFMALLGWGAGKAALRWKVLGIMSLGSDRIARHLPTIAAHAVLRWGDIALLCARFLLAASAAHVNIPAEQVVLLATTYFLLSVLAPAGALGFREMGTAGVGLATGGDTSQVALVSLIVSATELIASGALCIPACIRLRPDRVLRGITGK
jgi:hypothetical protein